MPVPPTSPLMVHEIGAAGFAVMILLPILLGGCQAPPERWSKPGATDADLRHDLADCEREGTGTPPFHFWALNDNYDTARDRIIRRKNDCMIARGWQTAALR